MVVLSPICASLFGQQGLESKNIIVRFFNYGWNIYKLYLTGLQTSGALLKQKHAKISDDLVKKEWN